MEVVAGPHTLLRGLVASLLLTAGAGAGLARATPTIDAVFWAHLDPVPGSFDRDATVSVPAAPLPTEDAARRLLERARVVFSGMVYGHRFRYVPADARRRVAEQFELAPVAELPWGQGRLSVVDTYTDGDRFVGRLRLRLHEAERAHRDAWGSNSVAEDSGTGEGNRFLGAEGRQAALEDAIRAAVRNVLRDQITKPREIRGQVLLWTPPTTVADAGRFHTTATIKLIVDRVVPYRVF